MKKLILASQSPRRKQILQEAGYSFVTDSVEVSEIIDENVNLRTAIGLLAEKKAKAYINRHKLLKSQDILILSADTMVVFNGKALGKPKDSQQAIDYLLEMSGKTHSVITAFCLADPSCDEFHIESVESIVEFKELTRAEVEKYVASGEPMDKAGAYAIQGEGRKFVKSYTGPWSNIVGLPIEEVKCVLEKKGLHGN